MKPTVILIAAVLAGCASPEELCAEKIRTLEALRAQTRADLFRQLAECEAHNIEFYGDAKIVSVCMDTYRSMQEAARYTLADIDKRLAAPDLQACIRVQFSYQE